MEPSRLALALDNILAAARSSGLLDAATAGAVAAVSTPGSGARPAAPARVPMRRLYDVWEQLAARGADAAFADFAAREAQPRSVNPLRLLAGASPNLLEALKVTHEFWPVVTDAYGFRWERGSEVVITFDPVPRRPGARLDLMFTMASFAEYALRWTNGRARFVECHVRDHAGSALRPASLAGVVASRVRMGARADRLVLTRDVADAPLVGADPGLARFLRPQAEALLAAVAGRSEARWTDRVRAAIAARSPVPRRLDASAGLGVSERTLRRRLAEEGTSFAALLEAERIELATSCVDTWNDEELAERLAYSDARAFRRAYQRWTGATPREARRSRGVAAALDVGPDRASPRSGRG